MADGRQVMEQKRFAGRWALIGLGLALVAGISLRLLYPTDIEWKVDEKWTFDHAVAMASGGAWSAVGMPSSAGMPNPGLSLWLFGGLVKLFSIDSPPQLARAVQGLNGLALVCLAIFAFTLAERNRREIWLWATALWAVNPLAIVFERKIWPPSVLPIFFVAFIASWNARRLPVAAFLWGLLGALMTQMHMGVLFLVAALFLWTLLDDWRSIRLGAWLAGCIVGTLPAIPWLMEIATLKAGTIHKLRVPIVTFYVRWIQQPFGLGAEYTLGPVHMREFLKGPPVEGYPSYALALAHVAVICILVFALIAGLRKLIRLRPSFGAMFLGSSPEAVLVNACLWGYGVLLTLATVIGANSHRHYMIVIAPVMALWCARLVFYGGEGPDDRRSQRLLVVLCVVQAFIAWGLLDYVHRTQDITGWEYGATWQSQQK